VPIGVRPPAAASRDDHIDADETAVQSGRPHRGPFTPREKEDIAEIVRLTETDELSAEDRDSAKHQGLVRVDFVPR
jgi:hypothetical protein